MAWAELLLISFMIVMVQWKKEEVNSLKWILRNIQIYLKNSKQKSPNPTVQAAKLGPL